ncbi:MAG TPA: DUF6185 family protein [Solirubrobacteraceae bacterium]
MTTRPVKAFGLWTASESGRTLTLASHDVAKDARLTVVLHLARLQVTSVQPLPATELSDRELVWIFGPGPTPQITVTVAQPVFGAFSTTVTTDFFALGLPFLAVLLLIPFKRRKRPREPSDVPSTVAVSRKSPPFGFAHDGPLEPERSLARASAVGIVLAIGNTLAFESFSGPWGKALSSITGSPFAASAATAIAFLLPYLLLADPKKAYLRAVWWCAAAIGLVVVLSKPQFTSTGGIPLYDEIASVALFAALVGATISASADWLAAVAPELALWWRARVTRSIRIVAVLGLSAAIVAPIRLVNDSTGLSLISAITSNSFSLAELALLLLVTIVSIGLLMLLWRLRDASQELAFDRLPIRGALLIMLATVVIGTGGRIDEYAIPVAFLLGLAGLAPALSSLTRSRRARALAIPGVRAQAVDLLRRAEKVTLLERHKEILADDLAARRISEEEYDDRRRQTDDRLADLESAEILVTADITETARRRELRTIGLAATQDLDSRIKLAIRWGSVAVAVPVAYNLIATTNQELPRIESSFGGAFLFGTLIGEAIVWPIAAFAFVAIFPLLPGRNGPLKGVGAALALVLPLALASVIVEAHTEPRVGWPFLAAELALLFAAIGVLIDYSSVRIAGMGARQLGELYRITSVRSALVYALPLAGILYAVLTQLSSGKTSDALAELVNHASALLPTSQH